MPSLGGTTSPLQVVDSSRAGKRICSSNLPPGTLHLPVVVPQGHVCSSFYGFSVENEEDQHGDDIYDHGIGNVDDDDNETIMIIIRIMIIRMTMMIMTMVVSISKVRIMMTMI